MPNNTSSDLIELIDLKSMPTTLNAFNKKLLSKFYLTLAYHFHQKNNSNKVKNILIKVDPNRLDKSVDSGACSPPIPFYVDPSFRDVDPTLN